MIAVGFVRAVQAGVMTDYIWREGGCKIVLSDKCVHTYSCVVKYEEEISRETGM
jgi:hypothetical protein